MTRLSVNINKVALLRNSRNGRVPDLLQFAQDCEEFGAQGITVHPRPDERHIRFSDLAPLKDLVGTEFNIEGYPNDRFMEAVLKIKPHQCTLVPDPPGVLTSSEGWKPEQSREFLKTVCDRLQEDGIRTVLFMDPDPNQLEQLDGIPIDRVELYTGDYAHDYLNDPESAVQKHRESAKILNEMGIGINAGHDLDLENLEFYVREVSPVLEVSIGHALIADALYYGLQNVIGMYLRKLQMGNAG